jgi:hypothetical protein
MLYPPGPNEPFRRRAYEWALSHKIETVIAGGIASAVIYRLLVLLLA